MLRRIPPLLRTTLLLSTTLLSAVVLTACSDDAPPVPPSPDEVRSGGTLRLSVAALPDSFNPYRADPLSSATDLTAPTSGGAVHVTDDGSWEVDPTYAESVEVVAQAPLTVAVRLAPAGVWSDGTPIDAADMQAFVAAQQSAAGQLSVDAARWRVVSGVEPGADPYSYTVTFTEPTADWPAFVYPGLPAEATEPGVYDDFAAAPPPSNGPFVVTAVDRAAGTVTYERNPRWWGEEPLLEGITVSSADAATAAESFVDGDLDVVAVDAGTIGAVSDTGRLVRSAGTEWSQVTLNAGRGPLVDPGVRRAIALAIDRDGFADDVAASLGGEPTTVGSVLLLPGQAGYTDTAASAYPHDPAEAGRLLAAAGFGPGGAPLTLRLPVPAGSPVSLGRAERVRDDLADVGVTVEIGEVPAEDFFASVVVALDFDLVTFLWDGRAFGLGEAAARFYPLDARENFTGQGDPAVGDVLTRARLTLDDAARPAVIAEADAAIFATAAIVPLALEPRVLAVGDDVAGIERTQLGRLDWTRVGFAD